ncbi:MAG: Fic family protein [Halobacteriota archaeon]|nr:Fic family protein [Halobacteriota archaeon]
MFEPNFRYTDKIVNDLVEIASAREIILNSYLIPKWEVSLRKEAIIRNAHASTSIEGNPLTIEEVSTLAAGRKLMVRKKDMNEVLNYLQVLEHISSYSSDGKITERSLLDVHRDLTKETLQMEEYSGRYRDRQVVVANRITGEVVFTPPSTDEVPVLINEFLEWLNSSRVKDINAIIVAGISHYEFVRIHPFVDGNGRTARALATLILYLRDFDTKRFFALDDYYNSDRTSYYNTLKSIDQETLDITGWLEYFTEGVMISISQIKERVLRLSSERLNRDKKAQIALSDRQMKIIEHLNRMDKITAGEVADMFGVSRQAALKELTKLKELNVIRLIGTGRGAHYVLV